LIHTSGKPFQSPAINFCTEEITHTHHHRFTVQSQKEKQKEKENRSDEMTSLLGQYVTPFSLSYYSIFPTRAYSHDMMVNLAFAT